MSDRREAVFDAISESVANAFEWDDVDVGGSYWDRQMGVITDAALAVIDAEPTDAEVEAARTAYFNTLGSIGWRPDIAFRNALIAARKARS